MIMTVQPHGQLYSECNHIPLATKFAYMFAIFLLGFVHKFGHISLTLLPFSAFLLLGLGLIP
jgi:hypothetical protein